MSSFTSELVNHSSRTDSMKIRENSILLPNWQNIAFNWVKDKDSNNWPIFLVQWAKKFKGFFQLYFVESELQAVKYLFISYVSSEVDVSFVLLIVCVSTQDGWLSADGQINHMDRWAHLTHSVFMLYSATHDILENQLTVICLALCVRRK